MAVGARDAPLLSRGRISNPAPAVHVVERHRIVATRERPIACRRILQCLAPLLPSRGERGHGVRVTESGRQARLQIGFS